jgi:hypothetical protein
VRSEAVILNPARCESQLPCKPGSGRFRLVRQIVVP